MDHIQLQNFEQSVETLVAECERLRRENQKLSLAVTQLHLKFAQVVANNQETHAKVKLVITKLKEQIA